jgi:ABC-type multidrug transport system fused ATPase/permease subunit
LVAANLSLHQAASAIQRIYEFLLEPAEAADGRDIVDAAGRIEFRRVTFAYPGGPDVLRDVSFTVEPGRAVALVGPSGAGKTTIVNLLLRFYETARGQVLLDDMDVGEISPAALRRLVGVVDQQPFLFSGTILDNIRLGRPEASVVEVEDAGRKAFAHEFIESLPEGYLTRVGERGVRLSGGQCQRIALARLFLKSPRILVLDEAVSAVDSASEAYIQQALAPLITTRTTIIIAHRLSSLMLASEVVLIEDGQVVDQGSHAHLMRHSEAYVRLFHEQFQPQSEPEPRRIEADGDPVLRA